MKPEAEDPFLLTLCLNRPWLMGYGYPSSLMQGDGLLAPALGAL